MKRYRFSLEAVLRARRAQESVARQRLAAANHRVLAARLAESERLAAYRSMSPAAEVTDSAGFLAERAHEARMAGAVEAARFATREAEVEAATCFAAWVEAGKQVASLERLEGRRRAEWEAEVLREEAAAVDDVVAYRWQPAPVGAGGRVGGPR